MKKKLLYTLLLSPLFFLASFAGESPKAVIIFDASGSMWGQIEGKPKIKIAREALKNVIGEWKPSVEVGLTVYGHRSKGDCNDIEAIIPVGKINRQKMIRTVMGISPKGKTPIARSLKKVAKELDYTEEKATIILISDGKESCDQDPCLTAKALKQKGIDFVAHVIGFNVNKKTDAQLRCIAKATGGAYFSAKNAASLNKAMKSIVKKVEKKVKKAPQVKKTVVKKRIIIPIDQRRSILPLEDERRTVRALEDERRTVKAMEDERPHIEVLKEAARKRILPMPEKVPETVPQNENNGSMAAVLPK